MIQTTKQPEVFARYMLAFAKVLLDLRYRAFHLRTTKCLPWTPYVSFPISVLYETDIRFSLQRSWHEGNQNLA